MVTGIYLLGEWGKRAGMPGLRLVLSKGSPTWSVRPNPVALKLSHVAESPGGLWKPRPLGPTLQNSDSVTSQMFPSGAGSRRSVENLWPQSICMVIVTTSDEACCAPRGSRVWVSIPAAPWKSEAGPLIPGNVHTVPAGSTLPLSAVHVSAYLFQHQTTLCVRNFTDEETEPERLSHLAKAMPLIKGGGKMCAHINWLQRVLLTKLLVSDVAHLSVDKKTATCKVRNWLSFWFWSLCYMPRAFWWQIHSSCFWKWQAHKCTGFKVEGAMVVL